MLKNIIRKMACQHKGQIWTCTQAD